MAKKKAKLKKWKVFGVVTGTKYLGEFEAATAEEAEQMAINDNGHVSLCHQCADECEDPEIHTCDVTEVEEQE